MSGLNEKVIKIVEYVHGALSGQTSEQTVVAK
jgi:hypothetical protein